MAAFQRPTVHNVVITTHTTVPLDLEYIASNATNTNYDPKRFAAVIMRLSEPYSTALFFNTGKVVCTGAKSVALAHSALDAFLAILTSIGIYHEAAPYSIENIVCASALVPAEAGSSGTWVLRLDQLSATRHVEYEPELFPGLSRRVTLSDGNISMVIVFASGKMILTGNRTMKHVEELYRFVAQWLPNYAERALPSSTPRRSVTPAKRKNH